MGRACLKNRLVYTAASSEVFSGHTSTANSITVFNTTIKSCSLPATLIADMIL